jgi:hypothetical protein
MKGVEAQLTPQCCLYVQLTAVRVTNLEVPPSSIYGREVVSLAGLTSAPIFRLRVMPSVGYKVVYAVRTTPRGIDLRRTENSIQSHVEADKLLYGCLRSDVASGYAVVNPYFILSGATPVKHIAIAPGRVTPRNSV